MVQLPMNFLDPNFEHLEPYLYQANHDCTTNTLTIANTHIKLCVKKWKYLNQNRGQN